MISNEMFGSDIIRVKVNGFLKNITDKDVLNIDVKGIKNKDKITYNMDNVKYVIKIDKDTVILIRENDEFLNTFVFSNKKSSSNYLLKENGYEMDIDVITENMEVDDNVISIKYRIVDTDCCYEFKIEVSCLL